MPYAPSRAWRPSGWSVGPELDESLLAAVPGPSLPIGDMPVRQVATLFGRAVDAMSVWTATHSAGVVAAAAEIAALVKLCPRERTGMEIAGWLHDAGKLEATEEVLDHHCYPPASARPA
ncbi:MAG TPA: hypothetical protein VFJ30_05535 [Phycisphaerae bacterium]|nr:hypothetical protein [Phycisphaerae bacterium]